MEAEDHLGHRQRLKSRWLKSGRHGFAQHEILELLLSFAIPRKDTKPLAKALLTRFGTLGRVLQSSPARLASEKGLGEHSALLLNIIGSLAVEIGHESIIGTVIQSPADISEFLLKILGHMQQEQFHLVLLNQQNKVLTVKLIEEGIENRAQIYLKKIIAACLDHGATGLICAHNHPSGQLKFSKADLQLTRGLKSILDPLEIRLLDHILLAGEGTLSMMSQHPDVFQ